MPMKTWGTEVLRADDVDTYLMRQAVITCTSSTRPAALVEGMHIWETDTQKGYVYSGGAWQFKEAPASVMFVRKTVDEFVTNSNTLQPDDELAVTVPAWSRWLMEIFIIYSSSTTADFQIGMDPAWSSWASFGPNTGETNKDSSLVTVKAFVTPSPIAGYGSDACWRGRGVMIYNNAATPQTTTFTWAQLTADASSTAVRAGSYLYLRLVDD
ncbi:hypothetical protein ACQPYK_08535 [Streptosporangium sp. CA-135522]|uniref:hypothetical protein n=1 Tax=Streptosporangium sp. CA-135522 TaxID=3240072 RepID=UPI003D9044AC